MIKFTSIQRVLMLSIVAVTTFTSCEKDSAVSTTSQLQNLLTKQKWVTTVVRDADGSIVYEANPNGTVSNKRDGGFLPRSQHGSWGFGISTWTSTGEFTFYNMLTPNNYRGAGVYTISADSTRTITFPNGTPTETKILSLNDNIFTYRRGDNYTVEHIPTTITVSSVPFPSDETILLNMRSRNWITSVVKDLNGVPVYTLSANGKGVVGLPDNDTDHSSWGFGISKWSNDGTFSFYKLIDDQRRGGGTYTVVNGERTLIFSPTNSPVTSITEASSTLFTYVREDGFTVEHIPTTRPVL